jgi:hypothetical protein
MSERSDAGQTGPMNDAAPLDHQRLLDEINEEVRRRRESGEIPADLERELDLVFARFAPVDALEDDFEQVLTRAEQATFIDTVAPVESSRPVVPYFKKVVRKVVGWYLRYIAHQTTAFAHAITRAVRLLGERVDLLEEASPVGVKDQPASRRPLGPGWVERAVDRMKSADGRVAHADAGDGSVVRALVAAGVDAYGIDPNPQPGASDTELREDEVVVHLRALPDAALGGLVLTGCVERLPVGALVKLADLALAKVKPGGPVMVVSVDPRWWAVNVDEVNVDLAPGRPLHRATWEHLLSERGFESVEGADGERQEGLKLLPRGNAVMNENLAVLNDLLFGPAEYAVVARRPA